MGINYRLPTIGSPRNDLLELVHPLAKEVVRKLEKELQKRNLYINVSNVLVDLVSFLREELFQVISKAAVLE